MRNVKVFFVGIGGYGATNLDTVMSGYEKNCDIVGVCDICPEKSQFYQQLLDMGVPIYKTMEEFFAEHTAELTVISTPIHMHAAQSCYAMEHGSNVLCEKPVASTVAEALEMKRVSEKTGKFVNIGYQASFHPGNLKFKEMVSSGRLGKLISASTVVLWPRTEAYYGRSPWAGKLTDGSGKLVLDSVTNNATAHYLHNMFYVLGGGANRSLVPENIEFELYRGNAIESFDTCALRVHCTTGETLHYFASHTVDKNIGPLTRFEFENGVAEIDPETKTLVLTEKDGTVTDFGDIFSDARTKLIHSAAMVRGDAEAVCCVEAALSHTKVVEAFHRDPAYIKDVACAVKEYDNSILHYVEGMDEVLLRCSRQLALPGELGCPWSGGVIREQIQ